MDPSPLKLKKTPEKRRLSAEISKCVICEVERDELTRKASSKGILTFLQALQKRIDHGDKETHRYMNTIVCKNANGDLNVIEPDKIQWHKGCYSSFTSNEHITRLQLASYLPSDTMPNEPSRSKIPRRSFMWTELCMFCEQKSYKKCKTLTNVATHNFCISLQKKASELGDSKLICKIGDDFLKLVTYEARYHKACHSKYMMTPLVVEENKPSNNVYDDTLKKLIDDILPHLREGKALMITDILRKYQSLLSEYVSAADAKRYTAQKLRNKLTTQYANILCIIQSSQQGNPYFVIDKSLKLEDIINSAARYKAAFKSVQVELDFASFSDTEQPLPEQMLFHAALFLRSLRVKCKGIETQSLNPSFICEEQEEKIVPKELCTFIYWLLAADRDFNTEIEETHEMKQRNPNMHQKILSICQDIIYVGSKGTCKTPKHVGLSVSLHQLTQSKEAVALVNKNGHGISYEEVERIDTSWAKDQQTINEVTIPSNMIPGLALRAAGDNFNRATESIDGKHLDIVNMVLYQQESNLANGTFADGRPTERVKSKTLNDLNPKEIFECPNLNGRQPGPRHLLGQVNLDLFFTCTDAHSDARAVDRVYIEARFLPTRMFEALIETDANALPGWTVYHARVSRNTNCIKTRIGYCPMIPAPATEFNTVYTMMKLFQQMFRTLGQDWTYVTYDEAIYSKAQMIKWRNRNEFENDELEMGGMHRAMNFMGDVGKILEESGFEDILIEGNVFGPSTTQVILKGRSYNRGVRAHKLMNEAMNRLKWRAFENWFMIKEIFLSEEEKELIVEDIKVLRGMLRDKANNHMELQERIDSLIIHTRKLHHLMDDFTIEGRIQSHTFTFWDNYVCNLSQLLLDYIAAKRDGNRELEFETFAEMLPYDFVCGHTNYARWGTVNVVEGKINT